MKVFLLSCSHWDGLLMRLLSCRARQLKWSDVTRLSGWNPSCTVSSSQSGKLVCPSPSAGWEKRPVCKNHQLLRLPCPGIFALCGGQRPKDRRGRGKGAINSFLIIQRSIMSAVNCDINVLFKFFFILAFQPVHRPPHITEPNAADSKRALNLWIKH